MKTSEKNLNQQVQVWGMLGPAALLLTLFVILVRAPFEGLALPLLAIAGFIASWVGGMKGVGASMVVLAGLAIHQLLDLGMTHALWYSGIACALALAWLSTALGRDEIEALLMHRRDRSEAHLKELAVSERKYQAEQQKITEQLTSALQSAAALRQELTQAQEEVTALQKQGEQYPVALKKMHSEHTQSLAAVNRDLDLALKENEVLSLAKEQTLTTQIAYEKALQEVKVLYSEKEAHQSHLIQCQTQIDSLQVRLNVSEEKAKELAKVASSLDSLRNELENTKQERDTLQATLAETDSLHVRLKASEEKAKELTQAAGSLESLRNEYAQIKQERDMLQANLEEKDEKIKALSSLESVLEALKQERDALKFEVQEKVVWGDTQTREGRALCRVEGLYQQLRIQYDQKSDLLDATRKELFHVQEQILLLQKERDEERVYGGSAAEKALETHIRGLTQDIERLEKENALLEDLVSNVVVSNG